MKIVRVNHRKHRTEETIAQVDSVEEGQRQIHQLAQQTAQGWPHDTRVAASGLHATGVYADNGEDQGLLVEYRLEIEPTEQTPGVYRGWQVDYAVNRPVTGVWRGERGGITCSGMTLDSVKHQIDGRIKDYPGSGGA